MSGSKVISKLFFSSPHSQWMSMGINIKGLFSSSSQFFFGSGFIASLLSFVGLFYLYFTVLNLFQLLAGCLLLGVPMFVIGRKTLVIKAASS
jgi:hypothetical protein